MMEVPRAPSFGGREGTW